MIVLRFSASLTNWFAVVLKVSLILVYYIKVLSKLVPKNISSSVLAKTVSNICSSCIYYIIKYSTEIAVIVAEYARYVYLGLENNKQNKTCTEALFIH